MDLDILENFALSDDREAALEPLIPGSEDAFFYKCLLAQQRGDADAVQALLTEWRAAWPRSARAEAMADREALRTWGDAPDASAERIISRLKVRFDHAPERAHRAVRAPSQLDAADAVAKLEANASRRVGLDHYTDAGAERLLDRKLPPERIRPLLKRVTRPDHPQIVPLVLAELADKKSGGFGSLEIHGRLLLPQLRELAAARPKLLDAPKFVEGWIQRLRPHADLARDDEALRGYLERIWAFLAPRGPVFNGLKAHALYHRMALDLRSGALDRDRLRTYLRLPRSASYIASDLVRVANRKHIAQLGQDYSRVTGLGSVADDTELIREILERLVALDPEWDAGAYRGAVREKILRRWYAEAKILAGQGDLEGWYAQLGGAEARRALRDRVELRLAPENPRIWTPERPVELLVDVKNAPELTVKVFEINTFNYLSAQNREVDAALDLDGLVASRELSWRFERPPHLRARERLAIDGLERPGVYVVELIGGGQSSRAVIRKGQLRALERVGAAGHVFTVVDASGARRGGAEVWVDRRRYTADEDGTILVPFTGSPQRKTILLRDGDECSLDRFHHQAERYAFSAGLFVDREALIAGAEAEVLVRPALRVGGADADPALIREPLIAIETTDRAGDPASVEAPLPLASDRESVHRFKVPPDLSQITVTVRGRITPLGGGDDVEVSASRSWTVNQIDTTARTDDAHLARTADGYVIYALGRTGEPRAGRRVWVSLTHRDYTHPHTTTLEADDRGRVALGALDGFTEVLARPDGGQQRRWTLHRDSALRAGQVHARAGEPIRIPHVGPEQAVDRAGFSLLERSAAGDGPVADRLAHLSIEGGALVANDLPPGEYDLLIWRDRARIRLVVSDGQPVAGWLLGSTGDVQRSADDPLRLVSAAVDGDRLRIQLRGPDEARVHVFASRFEPAHNAGSLAAGIAPHQAQRRAIAAPISDYLSGRDIGDEYRYVLARQRMEREGEAIFPGNTLPRPGLLLNPWARQETETATQAPVSQAAYASSRMAGAPAPRPARRSRAGRNPTQAEIEGFPNLDFLARPALVAHNLRATDGEVAIPAADLAGYNQVRVVAICGRQLAWREIALPEADTPHKDLRLLRSLPADGHFTERREVTALTPGDGLEIPDIRTSAIELYGTVARAFSLLQTLSNDSRLSHFSYLTRWPELSDAEQRRRYSEDACHELSFFLSRKDPGFFERVIQPYLRNKLHKTFLDRYLLGDDLSGWLEPWRYGRLNLVERILLGQRVDGESGPARRHVADRFDLLDPDPGGQEQRFRAAVLGGALELTDALGVAGAMAAESVMEAPMEMGAAEGFMSLEEEESDDEAEAEPTRGGGGGKKGRKRRLKADMGRRERAQKLYRSPATTKELAENNYDRLRPEQQGAGRVSVNAFWRDFAAHGGGPFLSSNFPAAAGNLTECLLALAVLDLPFSAPAPEVVWDGPRMQLTAGHPAIAFHKEIGAIDPEIAPGAAPLLVSQNLLRADDRVRWEGNQQVERYVSGLLEVHAVYVCQVVLTNPTSAHQTLEVLLQIPRGALPVNDGFVTRGRSMQLSAFSTQNIEYSFYFPSPGAFPHFPVHVTRGGDLAARADGATWQVVERLETADTGSWSWVSQRGTDDEALAFLARENLERLDLSKIAWRMKDRDFFERACDLLASRHVWSSVLWSYALKHRDGPRAASWLLHQRALLDRCGPWIGGALRLADPVERHDYEHLEYAPLVNARAHRLGDQPRITNDRFGQQYRRFLHQLGHKPAPDASDWLVASLYLLLQDRVRDGLDALARVDPERLDARLQHDYLAAWAALFQEDEAGARALAAPHRDAPVDRWRDRFRLLLAQVDSDESIAAGADDPQVDQTRQAARAPTLSFEIRDGAIDVRYANLETCQVSLYEMDIELLFSRQPFVQDAGRRFSFVAANHTWQVALPPGGRHTIPLPERYRSANLVVELTGAGVRASTAHYAHDLTLRVARDWGQVQVADGAGRLLPRVYVKVYGRERGGNVAFFKDGYTDLRGRFDYASLSTSALDRTERLSLLVLSREHGALIREVAPPAR